LKRLLLVLLLAFAAWALINIQVAAANAESNNDQLFLNYAQFHKTTSLQPVVQKSAVKSNPVIQVGRYDGKAYSKEEVVELINHYSRIYNIDPSLPLAIARCESGYNQFSKNRSSTASGVFQYLASTWSNTPAGKLGLSVFDADANVKMAVSSIAIHGTAPWLSSKSCWS
jgi:soluble lytic murein transglycosylase-like protein